MKCILLLCAAAIALLLMAGCTQTVPQVQPAVTTIPESPGTGTAAPVITTTSSVSDNTIVIINRAYTPAQITVTTGSIVRWVNKDTVTHKVVFSPDLRIDAFEISPSQSFSVKFSTAGVYNYSSSIYPSMQGSVVVI